MSPSGPSSRPEEVVADDAAHQVQPVPGGDEGVGEGTHLVEGRLEAGRGHPITVVARTPTAPSRICLGATRAPARTQGAVRAGAAPPAQVHVGPETGGRDRLASIARCTGHPVTSFNR